MGSTSQAAHFVWSGRNGRVMSVISDSCDEIAYAFGWPPPVCLPPVPAAASRTPVDAVGHSEEEEQQQQEQEEAAAVAVAAVTQALAAAVRVALRAAEALAVASAVVFTQALKAAPPVQIRKGVRTVHTHRSTIRTATFGCFKKSRRAFRAGSIP